VVLMSEKRGKKLQKINIMILGSYRPNDDIDDYDDNTLK